MQALPDIQAYDTLIFDLGGVIINLDTQATFRAFLAHNANLTPEIIHHPAALRYEMGLISDARFRDEVRGMISPRLTDEEIDECWNAMILDIPEWRLDLLRRLRNNHQLFLLSNTNDIHLRRVAERLGPHKLTAMDELFDRAYYSHRMNKRKPDTAIYEQVISENDLQPGATLFIDDNPDNIEGARKAGLHAYHLTDPEHLREIFHG